MKVKFCPRCGGRHIELVAGGVAGMMRCRKCGYDGIFPETEIRQKKKIRPSAVKLKKKPKTKNVRKKTK